MRIINCETTCEGGYHKGISLKDFTRNPSFTEYFQGVNIPLLNNSVPIKPFSDYGCVHVVRESTKYSNHLFEIHLKSVMDVFEKDGIIETQKNRNITLYKGLLIHEAAHILEGSFEPLNLKEIFKGLGNPDFTKNLFNIIEDYRIEINLPAKLHHRPDYHTCLDFMNLMIIGVAGKYKGDDNFTDFMNSLLTQVKCGGKLSEIIAGNPKKRLARNKKYSSIDEIVEIEDKFFAQETKKELQDKGIKDYGEFLDELSSRIYSLKMKTVIDSVKILPELYELIELEFPLEVENYTDKFNENVGNDNFEQGSIKPGSIEDIEKNKGKILDNIKRVSSSLCKDYGEEQKNEGTKKNTKIFYEYNENNHQITPAEVEFKRLERGDSKFEKEIRRNYSGIINTIAEQFEQLKLNRLQVLRMQDKPQSLNPVGLVYANIDPNFARKQRFYDTSLKNKRDCAIYYLIDASGSTEMEYNDTTILDIEKNSAACLYLAIDELESDESFFQKLFLFNSGGDTVLYEAEDISSMTKVNSSNANRDGAAIRGVTSKLIEERTKDKILFLFADGMPADSDYDNAVYDTSMAIKSAADQGIKVFYFLSNSDISKEEKSEFKVITQYTTDSKIILDPAKLPYAMKSIVEEYLI